MRQIILDTETTGLSADNGDRIIEVGCVELLNRRYTGHNLHHYINPQRSSHEDAVRIHGLTDAFLADKPVFAAIADEFLAYIAGAELIIHNAAFDIGFLDAELKRLGRGKLRDHVSGVIDTLVMARSMYPGKANSLDALCRRLEVDNTGRTLHGALLDAELLGEVYIRLTRGQDSLVIDDTAHTSHSAAGQEAAPQVDLRRYTLPVITASAAEVVLHEQVLTEIDKSSGGKTVWRLANA
ncbi:MAG: DNA polymerase III subunit epsilon [Leptothrix sp. (in: b-proteobacteria)]